MAVWRYAGALDDIWAGEMRAVNLGAVDVLPGNLDGMLVNPASACLHRCPARLDGTRILWA